MSTRKKHIDVHKNKSEVHITWDAAVRFTRPSSSQAWNWCVRGYQNISSQRPQTNNWRRVRIPAWHLGMVQTPRTKQQSATHFCTHFERQLQSRVADRVCGSFASRINLRLGHWKLSIKVEYVFEIVNSARPTQLGGNQVHLPHLSCHGTASTPPYAALRQKQLESHGRHFLP